MRGGAEREEGSKSPGLHRERTGRYKLSTRRAFGNLWPVYDSTESRASSSRYPAAEHSSCLRRSKNTHVFDRFPPTPMSGRAGFGRAHESGIVGESPGDQRDLLLPGHLEGKAVFFFLALPLSFGRTLALAVRASSGARSPMTQFSIHLGSVDCRKLETVSSIGFDRPVRLGIDNLDRQAPLDAVSSRLLKRCQESSRRI